MNNNTFNWKKFQFITEVQTAVINNATNLTFNNDDAKNIRHIFSATGTLSIMDDAFYAAERIPSDLTAHEAACDFCGYMLENLKEDNSDVPYWFARN